MTRGRRRRAHARETGAGAISTTSRVHCRTLVDEPRARARMRVLITIEHCFEWKIEKRVTLKRNVQERVTERRT
jgi:hypothetical protein